MKKTLLLSLIREIKHSFGRLISVILIVALGVGFVTGLMSTTPDMRNSIDAYYDKTATPDIFIQRLTGITKEDLEYFESFEGIDTTPILESNEEIKIDGNAVVGKITYLPIGNTNGVKLELIEGRLPENNHECVVEEKNMYLGEYKVGSTVTLSGIAYEITGVVKNPLHFGSYRETTSIGNGVVSTIIYFDSAYISLPVYSSIYIKDNNLIDYNTFSSRYKKEAEKRIDLLEKDLVEQYGEGNGFYVLSRETNPSYQMFKSDAKKVETVSIIFPIFFFMVAGLVALTTMTRLVDENRNEIGTLRALGYPKWMIVNKFLLYGLFASAIGSIIGVILGIRILPVVIYKTFDTYYTLPDLVIKYNWLSSSLWALGMILAIILITLYTIYRVLKEKPANLMMKKVPKAGKRILLEHIPFIWKKLPFRYKSTLRNVFRYKKHLLMTSIGIAGCTALIIAGFGIKDSISEIANRQYTDVFHYDLIVGITEDFSTSVDGSIDVHMENIKANGVETMDASLVVTDASINNYVSFYTINESKMKFNNEDVIITYQLAKKLGLKKGDTIFFLDNMGYNHSFVVTKIAVNYIGNYVYIGKETYEQSFNQKFTSNYLFVNLSNEQMENKDIIKEYLGLDNVVSADLSREAKNAYELLFQNMNYIIVVLIVSAGALAIIVVYNLTNINIIEREKEIATLKVLGYHKIEVSGYLYRETFVLTCFGVFFGIFAGMVLHYFVLKTIETAGVMFGQRVSLLSYGLSILLTFLFLALVDLILYPKLKKVEMVESLKSNE